MNDKIKQLAEQAGIKRVDLHYTEEQPPYTIVSYRGSPDNSDPLAKFAELIVRECADVVSNQYSADWGKWSNTMILEHFGVEE
jgi:hypothetical protein